MGIPTLISTATASNDASVSITSGIDSTYDEYMFVWTDVGPATNNVSFTFQANASDASGYNETITSTYFRADADEADSSAYVSYQSQTDQAQGTAYQIVGRNIGSGGDESSAGILHLFSPSSTTYVKHFYSVSNNYFEQDYTMTDYVAGYINTATAIDDIQFKMSSGNFDGVIQLYGIA